MKKLFVLGLALAAMSATLAIPAPVPTLLGVSGGFLVPDASIAQGVSLSAQSAVSYGWLSGIPFTSLQVGITKDLEASVGAFKWYDESMCWDVAAKYVLPWTIAKGKLALSGFYGHMGYYDTTQYDGVISCTWPVFNSSMFTAAVDFDHVYGTNRTVFEANLTKTLKNGAKLGAEYYWHGAYEGFLDNILTDDEVTYNTFGTLYLDYPVDPQFTVRLAITSIGDPSQEIGNTLVVGGTFKF